MEKGRAFETVVGFFVLMVALFFFYFVYHKSTWHSTNQYRLVAKFDKADGLEEGTDVKMSGVRVGKISRICVDPRQFFAVVEFYVSGDLKLPRDSSASVASDGLFGGKYLSLTPGGEDENIPEDGEIVNTVGPISFESLLGDFVRSKTESQDGETGNK
ncbi:MAG: outer membrane lipid asymmetry maintenance protein MlaD [Holosporaceae bacterium]|jgi:phospholipid/cholesterol/gamma-HCH transport system substrate-binding protein|nr:outer membrane lipid asymmetry maintenance protein MlaD [Holosporaceae bacterium]